VIVDEVGATFASPSSQLLDPSIPHRTTPRYLQYVPYRLLLPLPLILFLLFLPQLSNSPFPSSFHLSLEQTGSFELAPTPFLLCFVRYRLRLDPLEGRSAFLGSFLRPSLILASFHEFSLKPAFLFCSLPLPLLFSVLVIL
jgi:hypothetical protein